MAFTNKPATPPVVTQPETKPVAPPASPPASPPAAPTDKPDAKAAKPEPSSGDRIAALEKQVEAIKETMRRNGWTMKG